MFPDLKYQNIDNNKIHKHNNHNNNLKNNIYIKDLQGRIQLFEKGVGSNLREKGEHRASRAPLEKILKDSL